MNIYFPPRILEGNIGLVWLVVFVVVVCFLFSVLLGYELRGLSYIPAPGVNIVSDPVTCATRGDRPHPNPPEGLSPDSPSPDLSL